MLSDINKQLTSPNWRPHETVFMDRRGQFCDFIVWKCSARSGLQRPVCPPEVACGHSAEFAALMRHAQRRSNPGNGEGQWPAVLLREEVPDAGAPTGSFGPEGVVCASELLARLRAGESNV